MFGISHPGIGCNNPILGWDVWNIPSWDGMQESHPGMGCMECPILGWDAIIPSWDGMYGISHPRMGCPMYEWDFFRV
jgi:hypothetical protein